MECGYDPREVLIWNILRTQGECDKRQIAMVAQNIYEIMRGGSPCGVGSPSISNPNEDRDDEEVALGVFPHAMHMAFFH